MQKITTFPSKIILFGEHTVLHGSRSIALAINITGSSKIVDTETSEYGFYISDINNNKFILKFPDVNERIEIKLKMRLGCGLGSSAIVSLLIADYILYKRKQPCNQIIFNNIVTENLMEKCEENIVTRQFDTKLGDLVEKLELNLNLELKNQSSDIIENENGEKSVLLNTAFQIEHFFHGKSSGIDVATAFNGGMIQFNNLVITELKSDYLEKYKIIIWDSKLSKDTMKVTKGTVITSKIVMKVDNIVMRALEVLKREFQINELYMLIRENQDVLEELGVVPDIMMNEVLRMRKLGVECKVSGAGNGGHLITVVEKEKSFDGWTEVFIFK